MARTNTFEDQYWQNVPKGNAARTSLAQEHFTEYNTFTGTDIKAFILPQGDQLARREITSRLEQWETIATSSDVDDINQADITGEWYNSTIATGDESAQKDILPLVNLQSITISTFRAKSQVRALGHVNAKGLARGSRTVAGTFILTEFNRDSFWDILTASYHDLNYGDTGLILPDQMRPFDIILLFAHEMGSIAIRHIFGLEIVTNGVVYSIQDYYSENTVSYIAQDVGPLIPLGSTSLSGNDKFSDLSASRLKLRNLITTVRQGESLGSEFEYLKKARNPFR